MLSGLASNREGLGALLYWALNWRQTPCDTLPTCNSGMGSPKAVSDLGPPHFSSQPCMGWQHKEKNAMPLDMCVKGKGPFPIATIGMRE